MKHGATVEMYQKNW